MILFRSKTLYDYCEENDISIDEGQLEIYSAIHVEKGTRATMATELTALQAMLQPIFPGINLKSMMDGTISFMAILDEHPLAAAEFFNLYAKGTEQPFSLELAMTIRGYVTALFPAPAAAVAAEAPAIEEGGAGAGAGAGAGGDVVKPELPAVKGTGPTTARREQGGHSAFFKEKRAAQKRGREESDDAGSTYPLNAIVRV